MKLQLNPNRTTAQKAQALATSTAELGAGTEEPSRSSPFSHPSSRATFTALGAAATAAALTAPDVDAGIIQAGLTPFSVGPGSGTRTSATWAGLGDRAFRVQAFQDSTFASLFVHSKLAAKKKAAKKKGATSFTSISKFSWITGTGGVPPTGPEKKAAKNVGPRILALSSRVGPSLTGLTTYGGRTGAVRVWSITQDKNQVGDLAPETEGFVGFVFDAEGQTYYGWARVSYTLATDDQTASFSLLEAFYEDSGGSILAGHVPESGSSLGFLAIGLAGLEFWRRRKKKGEAQVVDKPAS